MDPPDNCGRWSAPLAQRRLGHRLVQGFDQLAGDSLRGLAALDQDAIAVLVHHDFVTRALAGQHAIELRDDFACGRVFQA